jgi:hypothetical protein
LRSASSEIQKLQDLLLTHTQTHERTHQEFVDLRLAHEKAHDTLQTSELDKLQLKFHAETREREMQTVFNEQKEELSKYVSERDSERDAHRRTHVNLNATIETWYLWWPMINRYHRV